MKTRLPAALLSLALSCPLFSDEPVPPPLVGFAAGLPGKQVRLTWESEAGIRYRIERSTDLGAPAGGGWKQVAMVEATGPAGEWRDTEAITTRAFYRIVQPQAEVFSIPEPVLPPGGGDLFIHGQRIPDGSMLVILVDGVPQEFPLTAMGGGMWRAPVMLGGAIPGASILSSAVRSPSGTDLVSLNVPITITATGRATDSPPSLPPGGPLAASNPIPGVGVVVKRNPIATTARMGQTNVLARYPAAAAWFSKKGYDSWKAHSDMAAVSTGENPLYGGSGNHGDNPLYTGDKGLRVVNNHAINTKGAGANVGRMMPSRTGMPGEVSFHHVALDLPCAAGPPLSWITTYRSKLPVSSGLGSGWDFSYNVSIEPVPVTAGENAPRLIVRDGGGRADVFHRQADGSYRCDGMFREGRFRSGVFTLTFADAGRWVFRPLDGSPGAGKISSIIDRNEVALTCAYDSSGMLSRVSDAFGRSLAVEWGSTAPSRIVSVTSQDATGSVSYQKIEYHYAPGSARLASVSAPFVPGSPPSVGPVSFTYTDGLPDPNLNGNLLTVQDGAGRLVDAYEYSGVTDPANPAYDTCSAHDRNRLGTTGAKFRTTIAALPGGGYEVCENDEVGRVAVSSFDKLHRLLRVRQYTGFATPDAPVTSSSLPAPATKLRATDPDFYETTCAYNADSLCIRITNPDGSGERVIYDRDFRKDSPVRERGNARVVSLVSSTGEVRSVTCDHLPGYGASESARPGNPIKGISVKCGRSPGGDPDQTGMVTAPGVLPGECDDTDELLSARLSMNVTTPRQTQGLSFGEKKKGGPRDSASGLATGRRMYSALSVNDDTDFGSDAVFAAIDDYDTDALVAYGDDSDFSPGIAGDMSFVSRIITAHGQSFTYSHDARGNLVSESGPVSGSGASISYNARGQVTSYSILDDMDVDSSFTKMVTYDDHDGFASSVVVDPEGLALTTAFGRDDLGRISSVTDPAGDTWSYGYDASGHLVTATSPPAPLPIVTAAVLDAGGCVARVDTAHLGADGKPVAENPAYSVFYVHDSRGRLSRVAVEERPVDASGVLVPDTLGLDHFAVTDITYDAAGQIVRLATPAASRGQSVDLSCAFSYDERGLLYETRHGDAGSSVPVVLRCDYDAFGALVRHTTVASGVPQPQTVITWDGFHRLSSVTDPMGNVTELDYDNSGYTTTTVRGEVQDVPGSAGNVMLYRSTARMGGPSLRAFNQNASRSNHTRAFNQNASRSNHTRAFNQNASRSNHTRLSLTGDLFFDVFATDDTCVEERFTPGSSAAPAMETTVVHRSSGGRPVSVSHGEDTVATMTYDTARRLAMVSDGAVTRAYTRDKKGRVTVCGDTDHFLVAGPPDKTFTMTLAYDALGRCVSVTDGVGNSSSMEWDSLGRCVSVKEPGGLVVRTAYDGSSATGPYSARTSADVDGDGQPDVLSTVLERCGETLWVENSYGDRTSFVRDGAGRLTRTDHPDLTHEQTIYDALGRAVSVRRKNGAVIACDYNLRGELTSISHSQLPAGVLPVAATTFSYNGLGDCVRTEQGSSVIAWTWDSLGNPLTETQGGRTVSRTFSQRGRTSITYPDGRRFAESRDALGRLLSITSLTATGTPVSPPVVVLEYAGHRVCTCIQGEHVRTSYSYRGDGTPGGADSSFDTPTEMIVTDSLAHELAHVVQQRDRNQRVMSRQTLFTSSAQGPGRMQSYTRDAQGHIASATTRTRASGSAPVTEDSVSYLYDKEGMRIQQTRNGVASDYTQSAAIPPGDRQMGQYSSWPGGAISWDDEGNLLGIQRGTTTHTSQYDAEGRLVSVSAAGSTLVSYGYDAIGRRVSRTTGGSSGSVTTHFVHDGADCIQEWGDDGTGTGTVNAAVTYASSDGTKYGITTRDGTVLYPVSSAASRPRSRQCSCPSGSYVMAAKNKVEHWGDPHENLNGKHIKDWEGRSRIVLVADASGSVTGRMDADDAGRPVFLTSDGVVTGTGPVSCTLPFGLWEPSIGMLLGPDDVYSPDLGMTVARGNGHVTVLKSAATGGGGSGGSRVQDHNSSRSNKSSR
ncbi:hypothetical protein OKA04_15865 [Luteolibacter flavescens]|uniref:Uncharacterized protein n=1 Tax=Luteolibacter flavescens TaxID=1859460 RepID=A0ABT3FSC5_9BACT|nr:hypothetical protein [Luteolibacter flavescens]MCW1886214.1 hypothetical protein [Luteolibacter flavescens]